MPIKPENRGRYPKDWALRSRFVREYRAGNCCEWCGLRNYSVGSRDADGRFVRLAGNGPCDYAGQGWSWPSGTGLTYAEAKEIAEINDQDGEHGLIVIVLTVAHVYDDRPEASSLLNLAALCQRCHNRHDQKRRLRDRRIAEQMSQPQLFGDAQ